MDKFAALFSPVHYGILAISEGIRLSIVLLDGTVVFRQLMPHQTSMHSMSWGCMGDTMLFQGSRGLHVVAFGGCAGSWAMQAVQTVRELTE